MGRIVRPMKDHAAHIDDILRDSRYSHVNFDLSWDEVAKYIVSSPEAVKIAATLINRYPDRFLFGADEVAPPDARKYMKVFYQYEPLWSALDPETCRKVRLGNYERIFDTARSKVHAWEAANSGGRGRPRCH
jgi:hypothetical protein